MKQNLQLFFTMLATLFVGAFANAQCPAGEAEVTIDVTTDSWGYESYWEITPTGDACGTNTIFSGGNTNVGCAGGGAQAAAAGDPGAMPDNATTTFTVGCFTVGTCLDLHSIDDWGDGSTTFDIKVDGVTMYSYTMGNVGTDVYNFCVTLQPQFDASIDSLSVGTPYSFIPLNQATPLSFGARINNLGMSDLTNAQINLDIIDMGTGTSIQTSSSALIPTLVAGTSQYEMVTPGFTASQTGIYAFSYTPSMTETDENTANDTLFMIINYTDSVLGRDYAQVSGSLGIGSGAGTNAKLGLTFSTPVLDTLTSISALLVNPTIGDSVRFSVYDMNGGTPNAEVATTDAYVFTSADTVGGQGVFLTLMLTTPYEFQANTNYAVMVNEYANNVTLAVDGNNYEPGTNWVYWDANGWATAESLSASFAVNYVLRANFNPVNTSSIVETEMIDANVYPNPTNGNVTVELAKAVNNASVIVYSVDGVLVSSDVVSGTSFNVNLEGLNKGMYIIELNNGSSKGIYRVTKN